MLNVNELRVGNWVNLEFSGPFQWDWKHFADYVKDKRDGYKLEHLGVDAVVSDKIEPIPLTPEVLGNCGFKEQGLVDFVKDGVRLSYNNAEGCFVHFSSMMRRLVVKNLHQLQNLFFALTGEELKIQLAAISSETIGN